jgi:Tfp pilus assembly protein PilN
VRAQIARGKLMSESDVTKPLDAWNQDSFLPEDYVKSKGERRANMLSLTLFGVMMLAVVAAFFATNRRWMGVRNEQRTINAMYVREAEKIEELKELEKQRAEMVTKAEVTAALVERVPRSVLFAELVSRMPKDVTLTQFSLDSQEIKASRKSSRSGGVRTLTGGSSKSKSKKSNEKKEEESSVYIPQFNQTLKIIGVGLSNDDIADYIENLRQCELLEQVELKFIKESKVDGVLLRSFELSSVIRKEADARGLVERTAPVEMPDVRSPDRLVPQMPLLLPPSVEIEEADNGDSTGELEQGAELETESDDVDNGTYFEILEEGDAEFEEFEEAEDGDVVFTVPSMPAVPSFGFSQSKWGSPSGFIDLMGSAARTAERVRSEKAAQELLDNPVAEEDEFVADETDAEESAESPATSDETETQAPPAEDPEAKPTSLWFEDPAAETDTESDDNSDPAVVPESEEEDEEPATGDADEGDDDKEDE